MSTGSRARVALEAERTGGASEDPRGVATDNVARGLRPGLPKRPALEEDAWEKIHREQEKTLERELEIGELRARRPQAAKRIKPQAPRIEEASKSDA